MTAAFGKSRRSRPKESKTHVNPTGPGWILMLMLLAMLIASINYGNNMAYILCFLLTGLMMIAYLATRNNLKGLHIKNVSFQPVFAEEDLQITFELHSGTRGNRVAIFPRLSQRFETEGFSGPYSISSFSRTTAQITFVASKRGRFTLTYITLVSVYPLGLFQAIRRIPVNKVYIVYPKPMGSHRWPELELHEGESSEGFYARGGDDFVGVRPYRPGESMNHIDWKAYARGRTLCVKEFTGGGDAQLWFSWEHLGNMDIEPRLSQLTKWVLEADQDGQEFGLRLPEVQIEPECSPGHRIKCLESLALFGSRSFR